jgi:hypothetical protein
MGVSQIVRGFFRAHQRRAPVGERLFFSRLRPERGKLLHRMADKIGLGHGTLQPLALGFGGLFAFLPRTPEIDEFCARFEIAAKGVEQRPMGGGIDKRARVVLAVNLHELLSNLAQHLHRHRVVVDESAGASVGKLHAA